MIEAFEKRRKRAATLVCLYGTGMGVSAGALVFGILFLIGKRIGAALPWYAYLAIALGVAGVLCGGILLFLYPTVKRFAKRLDTTYRLGERVQTMVEFSAEDSAVVQLQREQTEERLQALPKRKTTVWDILRLTVLPILAGATLTVALAVPAKETPKPPAPTEELYEGDVYDFARLEGVITNIEGSTLTVDLKATYVAGLEGVLETVKQEDITVREMTAAVTEAMTMLLTVTEQVNTYNAIAAGLEGEEELYPLMTALQTGGRGYERVADINLTMYSSLENKRAGILSAVTEALTEEFAQYFEDTLDGLDRGGYIAYIEDYAEALEGALAELPASEPLTVALTAFIDTLRDTVTDLRANPNLALDGTAGARTRAKTALTAFVGSEEGTGGALALHEQAHSEMLLDYTLQALHDIFGVEIPKDSDEEGTGGDGENDENQGGSGGGGSGSIERPNEGEILNAKPEEGESAYLPYYELLGKYQVRLLELLDDPNVSEELKGYIRAYLDGLQSAE